MKTQDEIVKRFEERKQDDFLGFEISIYLDYLDYQHAKPYLEDDATEEQWKDATKDIKNPKEAMIDYMSFAWEKANDCRGISASRSLSHFTAWLWLDGDNDIWPTLENYEYYGKDQLVTICKYLGIDSSQWDDGRRVNSGEE
jgi:hypothetical protein